MVSHSISGCWLHIICKLPLEGPIDYRGSLAVAHFILRREAGLEDDRMVGIVR